jgi:small subunit ribosomal protein S2
MVMTEEVLRSSGIHLGSKYRTQYMSDFVDSVSEQGFSIFNLEKILNRVDVAGRFLAHFNPKNVMVYAAAKDNEGGTRPQFVEPLQRMAELTGFCAITGRFMPGSFTNPKFSGHRDFEVVLLSDPMIDGRDKDGNLRKALLEAQGSGIPVVSICNSDAVVDYIDLVVPGNNRGNRAIATLYYLITRAVLLERGTIKPEDTLKYTLQEFESQNRPELPEEEE